MAKDEITPVLEQANGRRAKIKSLDEIPTDTKAKKLDPKIKKAVEAMFPKAKMQMVRVHSGGTAKEACKSVRAKAFTYGNDIYFAQPGFAKDTKMIAHELAHVLTSGKGKMPKEQTGKVYTTK
jgi:hypothetical protein